MFKRVIALMLGVAVLGAGGQVLGTGPASLSGAPLAFGSPVLIGVAGSGAAPQVAVSGRGNAVAVFTDVLTGTPYARVYARQLVNGVWQGVAQPLDSGLGNSYYPDVALSSSGNGVAVWTSTILSDTHVFASRLVGGAWQAATIVDLGVAGVLNLPPHVAVSSDGNGMVVFGDATNTYVSQLSSGTWQAPYRLSSPPSFAGTFPAIALSSDGNGLAVFHNAGSHVARRLVNGLWQPPESMDCANGLEHESHISLAFDGAGLVANGGCDLFGSVNVLSDGALQPALRLMLAVRTFGRAASAPDGTGLAVYGGADGHAYANRFSGSAWQGALSLDADLPGYAGASKPDVALTYDGSGGAVFYKADGTFAWRLFGKRLTHDVWQTGEVIGSGGVPTSTFDAPRVVAAADGSLVAVLGENGRIYANTYEAPPAAVAQLKPRSLDLGSVHMGLTSSPGVVTVANVGSAPMTITLVSLAGANPGDFGFAPNPTGSVITPGGSLTLSLTFAPTITGTRTALLSVADNAYGSPQNLALKGTGAGAGAISILQDSVCEGLVVNVHGVNFPYDPVHGIGTVQVSFDATPVVTVATAANGAFVATFTVPPAAGGLHTISAADTVQTAAGDAISLPVPFANLPIVFIPGVSGSVLQANSAFTYRAPPDPNLFPVETGAYSPEQHSYSIGERVWLSGIGTTEALLGYSRYFDALRLQPDGVAPLPDMNGAPADLGVNGVLFDVPGLKYTDVYSGLRNYLVAQGYVEGQTLFYFPYDWRKDLGPTAADLDAAINQALAASGQSKAVIVAHSMGALVARNYVLRFGVSKLDQVITLGAPYLGAPKVAKALEVGDDWGIGWHTAFALGAGLHPKELMKMAQNYASAYELAPSREWFNSRTDAGMDPRYIVRTTLNGGTLTTSPLDFPATEGFLASRHNAPLLGAAEGFHNPAIGDLTQPGPFYFDQQIIGVDVPTLGHIQFTPSQASALFCVTPLGPCWTLTVPLPELAIPRTDMLGDGTVPLHSAWGSDRRSGDYRFYYLSGVSHMDLPLDSKAQFLLGEMLKGRMCSNQQNPYVAVTSVAGAPASAAGLAATQATTATLATGMQVLVVGTAGLNVFDALGRHTGPVSNTNPGTETGIPGVGYERSDGAQVARIAAGGVYTVVLRGTQASGAAMLRLSAMSGGAVTQTVAFEGIPITTTTLVTFTLSLPGVPAATSPVTQFDAGWPVQSVNALGVLSGTASQDITPPLTYISLEASRNVSITAQDEPGGSGVWRIFYTTEITPVHYSEYTGTLSLPAGGAVTAFAMDRAGNAAYPPARLAYQMYLPLVVKGQ
jgi:pimeloyl-ACP methyl ester carboxylesterase